MKWLNAFTAAMIRRSRFAFPASGQSCQQESVDTCRTALTMRETPSHAVTVRLERRAMSLHNRNRDAAERYLQLHQMLSKGR